jgi:hypothetical protein
VDKPPELILGRKSMAAVRPKAWLERHGKAWGKYLNAIKSLKRLEELENRVEDFWTDMTPAQVAAIKLMQDKHLRFLDKLLPDKLQVETDVTIKVEVG